MAVIYGTVIIVTFLFLSTLNFINAQIIINTSAGSVSGTNVNGTMLTNLTYRAFTNIPYALPPTLTLRFKAPIAYSANITGNINTKTGTVMCPQSMGVTVIVDEDCLILNVYTPLDANSNSSYPVMVWIHGGSFTSGFAALYQPEFFIAESVVVVTINYRLGALGFLSLGNKDAPGNAGLKDQTLAMRWVYNEIHNFGGDNGKITLFGESAGAASVHHHLLSSYSKGLFQQAIMQSGNAIASWAYLESGYVDKATQLAQLVGCAANNEVNLTCLQNAPVNDIITYQNLPVDIEDEIPATSLHFLPVKEVDAVEAFQSETIANLLITVANPVKSIMGVNKDEGLLTIRQSNVYFSNFLRNLKYFIPPTIKSSLPDAEITTRVNKIKAQYFGNKSPPTLYNYHGFVDLYTDKVFALPTLQAAQSLLAQNASVYMYRFNYDGEFKLIVTDSYKLGVSGVAHADDLGYLFPISYTKQTTSGEAYSILRMMVKMWTSFATSGSPIPSVVSAESLLYNVTWDPITSSLSKYLAITATPTMVSANFSEPSVVQLWEDVIQTASSAFLLQPMLALIIISYLATKFFSYM